MTIHAWTRGRSESLFRIVAPAKDRGNGTLKIAREMLIFNPGFAGSDFCYFINDLLRIQEDATGLSVVKFAQICLHLPGG